MNEPSRPYPCIRCLTQDDEKRIKLIPFLNIDSLLIPSPFIKDKTIDIDYRHSYVWEEEGEILGYILVYADPEHSRFHIYKQVTSPFGRGKGIGSAFIETLVSDVDPAAQIYLYVWEKLTSSLDFFTSKGFSRQEDIVYRKMKFCLMSASAGLLREKLSQGTTRSSSSAEELGKVRHDALKALKVLIDMVSMLSVDNCNKVIEDINRETTALLNTLNMYEDTIAAEHEVHIKELLTDRVIPFVEAADVPCEIRLYLSAKIPTVIGNYVNFSRALINVVANSLDAIREAGRRGLIVISLKEQDDTVRLMIQDNGIGITADRLAIGPDSLPLFVGKTTKAGDPAREVTAGQGIGTRQIFSTFGPANITVESNRGSFTRWHIQLRKSTQKEAVLMAELKTRYVMFIKSTESITISEASSRTSVAAFIWQLRQMEIFSYDLIYQFSRYCNVRDIFRTILLYRYGNKDFAFLKTELKKYRIDNEVVKSWLLGIVRRIKRNEQFVAATFPFAEYKGILLKSYGQAMHKTIIFTLDPYSGHFHATDRKLAEHLDFVPYLGGERDRLLRGEFVGDVRTIASPIHLGVWSIASTEDVLDRLRLIRQGARQLMIMGIKGSKQLAFYATTYNTSAYAINTLKTLTIGTMAALDDEELKELISSADEELQGMVFAT